MTDGGRTSKTPRTSTGFVGRVWGSLAQAAWNIRIRMEWFLSRRPHRSFQNTRRRDYVRELKLPGYWAFTTFVMQVLWGVRKVIGGMILLYAALYGFLVGMVSQETLTTLRDTVSDAGAIVYGDLSAAGEAGIVLLSGVTGSFNPVQSEAGQVYAGLLAVLAWLAVVWLLRAKLAGRAPTLRDALYFSGAPLVPMLLVAIVLVIQLLPAAIGVIVFNAAISSEFISDGVGGMLIGVGAALLIVLSLFWITSTFFAMIMVTLPGMYPMRALRLSGDIVTGRRLRILLRWMWMFVIVLLLWVAIMLPAVLLDGWLKDIWPAIAWLPILPIILLGISGLTVVFSAAYIYLLYRKIVDSDATV